MKDIIITKKRQKIELITLSVCFIIAFALNIYAIIEYNGKWNELFWSLGFVITATFIIYIMWTVLRIIAHFIYSSFNKTTK